jgi:hypothetical protein
MYSKIVLRTRGGRSGAESIRATTVADSPDALWLPLMMVQVVLRDKPSAAAWSSRLVHPSATRASRISRIFAAWRAFRPEIEVTTWRRRSGGCMASASHLAACSRCSEQVLMNSVLHFGAAPCSSEQFKCQLVRQQILPKDQSRGTSICKYLGRNSPMACTNLAENCLLTSKWEPPDSARPAHALFSPSAPAAPWLPPVTAAAPSSSSAPCAPSCPPARASP